MKKEFGVGSISLVLFILSILWSVNINGLNGFCLGDAVLNFVNLPAWSTYPNGSIGLHYTVFYSFAILILAIIVGQKFPEHIFAKSGKILSAICALIFVFFWITSSMTIQG